MFLHSVVKDCYGPKTVHEDDFHLEFEHDNDTGLIKSMTLKENHVFDVTQLKLDVNPVVCYIGKV